MTNKNYSIQLNIIFRIYENFLILTQILNSVPKISFKKYIRIQSYSIFIIEKLDFFLSVLHCMKGYVPSLICI